MTVQADPKSQAFFWSVLAIGVVVAALPYGIGLSLTPGGHLFQGNTILAAGDPNVYYSYIEQARQGAWLMRDVFTSEPHAATIWQPVWLVLGWLANLLHLSTPMVYALGRLTSLVVFICTAWWLIKWVWTDRLTRRVALVMVVGASGLGGLFALITQLPLGNILALPPDLWVSEMVPLVSSWTTPHFLFVTSGLLFILGSVEREWQRTTWRHWWIVGVVGLLTFSIHPFHILTVVTLWTVLTLWRWKRQRHFPAPYVLRWGSVTLMSLPALAYYVVGLVADPIVIERASQNINLTPTWWLVLIGLGVLPILALVGIRRLWATNTPAALWLGVWAMVHLLIIYIPFMSQRRLMHALIIPLTLLAAPLVSMAWRQWSKTLSLRIVFVVIAVGLFSGSTIITGHHIVRDYVLEQRGRNHWEYYLTPEYQEFFSALKQNVPDHQPILASLWNSNLIAGFTARTVVVGHPVETINYEKKLARLNDFFRSMTMTQQEAMLRDFQACYVLWGPRERSYGNAFRPAEWSSLDQVWTGSTMTLYRFTGCPA